MPYWERAPDPRLAAFVERISFSSDPPGEPSPPIRVIPDGRIDLLSSVDDRGEGRADVFGVKTAALFAQSVRPVTNVALHFLPGAASALLGVRADELTDRTVAADELFGAGFTARLLDASGPRARSSALESALLARARATDAGVDSLARIAARRIERQAGQVRLRGSRSSSGWRAPARTRISCASWRRAEDVRAHRAFPRRLARARARRAAGRDRARPGLLRPAAPGARLRGFRVRPPASDFSKPRVLRRD
jgi:hypothetical protein